MSTTIALQVADAGAERAAGELPPVKFHLSLNVADLSKSIDFYRVLFGVQPAKCYADYAKFELADPPLVLSLEPQPHAAGGALNHLGFRLPDSVALIEVQRRLETAGIPTTREDGVECCHAWQTKFWARDPDRNNWEMYVLEADIEHHGDGHAPSQSSDAEQTPIAEEVLWEHQLGDDFPSSIPLAEGAADRVLLRGTFNVPLSEMEQHRMLKEARRVLRQGGRLQVHGLVADNPLSAAPLSLPGPAAVVRHVPVSSVLLSAVQAAGFASLRLAKFSTSPVFRHEGVCLRELLLEATRLDATPFDLKQVVLYKGPLREVADDAGNRYPRGERVTISSRAAELLRGGALAESFLFFLPGQE